MAKASNSKMDTRLDPARVSDDCPKTFADSEPTAGIALSTAIRLLVCVAVVVPASGCTVYQGVTNYIAYNSQTDDVVIGWRDYVYSRRAYNLREPNLPTGRFPGSFKAGFIAGYHNVAGGGNGCPPSLPPRKYWSWKYQTPEGQCKVNAWFEGYPHGARAAEEDGIGYYRDIQISGNVQALIDKQRGVTGSGAAGCLDCGPKDNLNPPLEYPDGEIVEPGLEMQEPILPPADPTAGFDDEQQQFMVKPVNYVLERLPPTQPTTDQLPPN